MLGNFQCWGALLIWTMVGEEPIVLAVGVDGGGWGLDIFSCLSLGDSLIKTKSC